MDRDVATRVAEILEANPDGISRAGLMAWSRLRIAPDLTDEQLDAALAALGAAVSIEGGFIRLARSEDAAAGSPSTSTDGSATSAPADSHVAQDRPTAGWSTAAMSHEGGGQGQTAREGEPPDEGPGPKQPAFSTVALLDGQAPPSDGSTAGSGWVPGTGPRRSIRGLMAVAALVVIGLIGLLGRGASDGSSAGATSVPSDPRGSIAAAGELAVGSCFVVPVATTFGEVEIRPCDAPHDGEVVAIWDYQQTGSTYPTEAEWQAGVDPRCQAAAETYAGLRIDGQSEITYSWFYPAEGAWAQGRRTIQCFLAPVAGTLTRSYRATP